MFERDVEEEKLRKQRNAAARAFFEKKRQEQDVALEEPPPNEDAKPDTQSEKPKAVLRNPTFLAEYIQFFDKTPVEVELELPSEQEGRKRVGFELFALTPKGPQSISRGEGFAKNGKAKAELPVYKPNYREDGKLLDEVDIYLKATHSLADEVDNRPAPARVKGTAEPFVDSAVLEGLTFELNQSFIRPEVVGAMKAVDQKLSQWRQQHPDCKVALFGHTDKSGEELHNKKLSERRAQSAYAFIRDDADTWEALYQEEKWGMKAIQSLLKDQRHDPGPIDGIDGPKTQSAVRSFQQTQGMGESGQVDATTRKALFRVYMSGKHDVKLTDKDFVRIGEAPHMGCGEYNPLNTDSDQSEPNRRVTFLLLRTSKEIPVHFPCKKSDIAPCQKQLAIKKGERRTPTYGCHFYDKLVREEKKGGGKAQPPSSPNKATLRGQVYYSRTWNYQDETKTIAAVKEFLPGIKIELWTQATSTDKPKLTQTVFATDGVVNSLDASHTSAGKFEFKEVDKCHRAFFRIFLEYRDGKACVIKGKTIKGNTKFVDQPDFQIHTGKAVWQATSLDLSSIQWKGAVEDLGTVELTRATFVDLCDAYKSVWFGWKRVAELTGDKLPICQINYPEDPDISVSNASSQMQLCHDDLKDRSVILHEYGHFIGHHRLNGLPHASYNYNDDATGSHGRDSKEHYESAWTEGHATFLSCALMDDPHYHDGYDTSLDYHLDKDNTLLGPHSEGSIQEALWRIHKVHGVDFKTGFWKAFSDQSIRKASTIFAFFENWKDLGCPDLDKVVESYKRFNMEYGYRYPEGGERFKNVASPKVMDKAKKQFQKVDELHKEFGSVGSGTKGEYDEEFYNRNKEFNPGNLAKGSTPVHPKVTTGKMYIAPRRFQVKA